MSETGPLSDVVVLDLTRALAGPQAAMMLGDLGARVIKVESADRRRHPGLGAAVGRRGPTGDHEDSTYFMSANRNKESLVLDLKDAGRRRGARRAGTTRRRAAGELPRSASSTGSASPSSGCTSSTRAW